GRAGCPRGRGDHCACDPGSRCSLRFCACRSRAASRGSARASLRRLTLLEEQDMPKLTIAKAMAEAVSQEMRRDPSVFFMGEDIGALGGVWGNTRGLLQEFGESRVRDTPISETAYIGAAVGAAMLGMRPIVELMFVDFFGVCMDPIYNLAAKNAYHSAG